jgi:hypothetical protein
MTSERPRPNKKSQNEKRAKSKWIGKKTTMKKGLNGRRT